MDTAAFNTATITPVRVSSEGEIVCEVRITGPNPLLWGFPGRYGTLQATIDAFVPCLDGDIRTQVIEVLRKQEPVDLLKKAGLITHSQRPRVVAEPRARKLASLLEAFKNRGRASRYRTSSTAIARAPRTRGGFVYRQRRKRQVGPLLIRSLNYYAGSSRSRASLPC